VDFVILNNSEVSNVMMGFFIS